MTTWTARHVRAHPIRLLVTTMVVIVASWVFAGYAIVSAFDASHDATVATCRSLNELRRQLFVAAIDLGAEPAVARRFLPSENCEDLP